MIIGGRSIRLFLVDGQAGGVVTAEVVNWTGHLLLSPRSKLGEVLNRPELQKTGVYFLFSELTELGGKRPVYIGESDNVGRRISQHARNEGKEFDQFCVVTSKDLNLTKSHARYLENRFTIIASESDRAEVSNSNQPPQGSLPEADVADMNYFVEQVRLVLPVLGFDVLKEKFVVPKRTAEIVEIRIPAEADGLKLKLRSGRAGITADAVERDGEVLVLSVSLADKDPDHSVNQYAALRDRLISDQTLQALDDTKFLKFTRDTLFSSPTAAAAVIYGRNANGRTSWVIADTNQTLKDYQDMQAAE